MSDENDDRSYRSDCVFYICAAVLILLFAGDPDIHDALVHYLMSK